MIIDEDPLLNRHFVWYNRTKQQWQTYDNVYSVYRGLVHMVDGYSIETSTLQDARTLAQTLGGTLVVSSSAWDRSDARASLGQLVTRFDGAKARTKTRALDCFSFALAISDTKGVTYAAEIQGLTFAAAEQLGERLHDIRAGLYPSMQFYRARVRALIYELETLCASIPWHLRSISTALNGNTNPRQATRQAREAVAALTIRPYDISQAHNKLRSQMGRIDRVIEQGNRTHTHRAVETAITWARVLLLIKRLQHILLLVSRGERHPQQVDPLHVERAANGLRSMIDRNLAHVPGSVAAQLSSPLTEAAFLLTPTTPPNFGEAKNLLKKALKGL